MNITYRLFKTAGMKPTLKSFGNWSYTLLINTLLIENLHPKEKKMRNKRLNGHLRHLNWHPEPNKDTFHISVLPSLILGASSKKITT